MCYMMGKGAYLTDSDDRDGAHNMAHLMFFTPRIDPAEWGANMEKSPVVIDLRPPGRPRTDQCVHGPDRHVVGWNACRAQLRTAMRGATAKSVQPRGGDERQSIHCSCALVVRSDGTSAPTD